MAIISKFIHDSNLITKTWNETMKRDFRGRGNDIRGGGERGREEMEKTEGRRGEE